MNIRKVTLTGADDSVRVEDLLRITERFPFVEWAILVSKRTGGFASPRYPSIQWMEGLAFWNKVCKFPIQLSLHICGRWVRDICKGDWTIINEGPSIADYQRIQLNFHAMVHTIDREKFINGLRNPLLANKQFIFQLDDVNNGLLDIAQEAGINAVPLFDVSGGAGVLPSEWPKARLPLSGFAGGLSPDNLQQQLQLIEQVAGDNPIWIDAETHVRSNDNQQFDLDKVTRFLEIAKPWVNIGS